VVRMRSTLPGMLPSLAGNQPGAGFQESPRESSEESEAALVYRAGQQI
jgi:hypothetical protein